MWTNQERTEKKGVWGDVNWPVIETKEHMALQKRVLHSAVSELALSYSQVWVWRQGVDGSVVFTLDHLSTKQQCQCKQNALGNKFVLLWNTHEQNISANANSTPRHFWQLSEHLLCLLTHLLALLNNKCFSNVCLAGVASMQSMSQAYLFGHYGHPQRIFSSKQKKYFCCTDRPMTDQSPHRYKAHRWKKWKRLLIFYIFRLTCIFTQCSL